MSGGNGVAKGVEGAAEEDDWMDRREMGEALLRDTALGATRIAELVGVSRQSVYAWAEAIGVDMGARRHREGSERPAEGRGDDPAFTPAVLAVGGAEGTSPVVELLARTQAIELALDATRTLVEAQGRDLARVVGLLDGLARPSLPSTQLG